MTPDPLHREDTQPDDGESDATRRIHPGVEEPVETTKPEQPKGLMSFAPGGIRASAGRTETAVRGKAAPDRKERGPKQGAAGPGGRGGHHDLRVSGDVLQFERDEGPLRPLRNKPNLGRPDTPAATGQNQGSVTPLLTADTSNQDSNGDQISPEDVKATGRMRMNTPPKTPKTLANVPPMDDPALEAYRQAKAGYSAPPPPHGGRQRPFSRSASRAASATKRMPSRNRRLFSFATTRRLPTRPSVRPP